MASLTSVSHFSAAAQAEPQSDSSSIRNKYDRLPLQFDFPSSDYSPVAQEPKAHAYQHPPESPNSSAYNRAFDVAERSLPSPSSPTALPHFVRKICLFAPVRIRSSRTDLSILAPHHVAPPLKPTLVRSVSTTSLANFDKIEPLVPSSAQPEAFRAQLVQLKFSDIQHVLENEEQYREYFLSLPLLKEPECIRAGTSCKVYGLSTGIKHKPPIAIKLITNPRQFSTTAIYDEDVGEHLAKDLDGFSDFRVVLPKEIYYLRKLSGSNDLSFTIEPGPDCQLAFTQMPAFSGKTLVDWIETHKTSPDFNELAILRNAYHIALALEFLNDHQRSHTDVHAKNILVENGIWFLCDFGLLQKIRPDGSLPYGYGNRFISPPERLNGSSSGLKVDAWSFGLLLYYALHRGTHLYESPEDIQNAREDFPISDSVSLNTQDLLRGALHPDQDHRYTMGDIVRGLGEIPGVIPSPDDDDNKSN